MTQLCLLEYLRATIIIFFSIVCLQCSAVDVSLFYCDLYGTIRYSCYRNPSITMVKHLKECSFHHLIHVGFKTHLDDMIAMRKATSKISQPREYPKWAHREASEEPKTPN